jgi:peptidoglycan/xylan/chitin deacetylase (PgdA/CDA1 family)
MRKGGTMRNPNAKKNHRLGLTFVKVIIFTLCITSLLGAGLSEATLASSENQSSLLLQEISKLHKDNATLKCQNETLIDIIKKNESLYIKKLANAKIAYLTFDDGPSSNTSAILAVLKQYDIKATFFVNGHPHLRDLYKQISDDGHALANHTYSHDYKKIYKSADNFKKDVKELDTFLKETTVTEPNYILRYPGGSNNHIGRNYGGIGIMNSVIKEMNKEGYLYFDWNVDSSDAYVSRQTKDNIVQAVLTQSNTLNNPIILMHDLDSKTTTVEALPEIIEGLLNKGFTFDVLSKDTPAPQFKVVN